MDTQILTFRTIIQKDGKYYHGFVPSLPGCHTQGETIEETKRNLREAITGCLVVYAKHNIPISKEEGLESVESFDMKEILPEKFRLTYA
jgi:predicted RNase H-like HicB family nuclease